MGRSDIRQPPNTGHDYALRVIVACRLLARGLIADLHSDGIWRARFGERSLV